MVLIPTSCAADNVVVGAAPTAPTTTAATPTCGIFISTF